jgi:hypothetical protein
MMRQISNFLNRRICSAVGNENEEILPVSGTELLNFLASKRRQNPGMKKGSLASFKSAVVKFRQIDCIPEFSAREDLEISRFLKGVRNLRCESVREDVVLEDYFVIYLT